jgi:hypothetical protein
MDREVQVGGVYSVARAEGYFGVVKVVAHQPERSTIYARTFGPHFKVRPEAEWFEDRQPGKLDEELGIGIGVLPVTQRVFEFWQPELLFSQAITEAEREDLGFCFGMAQPWDDLMYA